MRGGLVGSDSIEMPGGTYKVVVETATRIIEVPDVSVRRGEMTTVVLEKKAGEVAIHINIRNSFSLSGENFTIFSNEYAGISLSH